MHSNSRTVRRAQWLLEVLEARWLPTVPPTLTIPLDPTLDQFGDQIVSVQAYGDSSRTAFGIFDTGASAVTFSADDQAIFSSFVGTPIPVKVPGGAQADGIGGSVTGDVSQPGTILADGLHAANLTFDDQGFPVFNFAYGPGSASTDGIQTFIGTADGSPDLPTITGTPLLNPSASNPSGYAALVDLQGEKLDFSDILPGLVLYMPDLHFVSPTTTLSAATGTTDPVRVSLTPYGTDNHTDPGNDITSSPNATQIDVTLASASAAVTHQNFLFDTGSQLTVISTATAQALGLDLANPETTITVTGVGGSVDVPGFTLPQLDVPRTDGGIIQFTNVPVYVLDVAPDISGILGMNLLDTAAQALYNPLDAAGPSLSLTFYTNPDRGLGTTDPGGLNALLQKGVPFTGAIKGHQIPGFHVSSQGTPEATLADYDGDHKSDVGVFRMGTGQWFIDQSTAGPISVQFGAPSGDIPLQGDFNGDGKMDFVVYRQSTAEWFIKDSAGNYKKFQFGEAGVDIPVPGDYDGDGKTDFAVYRPTTGTWYIIGSTSGHEAIHLGQPGDIPVPGIYGQDGKLDPAVFRPSTAQWVIQFGNNQITLPFGQPGDMPVPADYDGDGVTDMAVYRPSNATFYVDGSAGHQFSAQLGEVGVDIPVPANYSGTAATDFAVFRPTTDQWFILTSTGLRISTQLGEPRVDIPLELPLAYRLAGAFASSTPGSHAKSFGSPIAAGPPASSGMRLVQSVTATAPTADVLVAIGPADVAVQALVNLAPAQRARHTVVLDAALESLGA